MDTTKLSFEWVVLHSYNITLPIRFQNVTDNCLCDGDSFVVSLTLWLGFFIYSF